MNNIAQKYNRNLILLFVFAPFIAYFTISYLNMDFKRIMQAFSYIGVLLLLLYRTKRFSIRFPRYLLYYLLFILYTFYSTFIQLDREFKLKYLFSNYLLGALNIMFIIENLYIPKNYFNSLITYSKHILIIAVFVIIIQQIFNPNFFVDPNWFEEGFRSVLANNTDRLPSIYSWISALALGFGFIPIFILIVEDLDIKNKKIMLWIIVGIIFAFLSKARWVMLNALLVFFILFINHRDKFLQFIKYLIILPITIVISFFVLNSVGIDATGIVKDRILESDKEINQKSANTRILAFKALDKVFWEHPFFGVGNIKYGMGGTGKQDYKLRRFLGGRSSQIHVGYLSLFYMYGMIGGFFFLSFLYLLLKKLYQNAKNTKIWAPFLGFFGLVLANMTLVAFSVFEMGFIIALVVDRYYTQHKNIKTNRIT